MREAIIHIPHDEYEAVGLGEFVATVRESDLRDLTELACESEGCLLVVTVGTPIAADDLDAIGAVAWWERLTDRDDQVDYLIKLDFSALDDDLGPTLTSSVSNDEIRVGETGLDVALVGSQEEIAREVDDYADAGITVLLERIGDYRGPSRSLDALTDRQLEILTTAYDQGYFDVPRSASTADVAATLDLDPSTVTEHLQRAERNLLSTLLDGQPR